MNYPGRMPIGRGATGVYAFLDSVGRALGQLKITYDEGATAGLEDALSLERFESYLASSNGDRQLACRMYALNTSVSASLYGPLQMLEVALRNRFHHSLSERYGDWWFDELGVITEVFQRQKLKEAKLGLVSQRKPLTPGRIVASLTFGFWTSCLGSGYEDSLWRICLHKAFAGRPVKTERKQINRLLTPIRELRNRIAHHEPILYWDLPKHHTNILFVTDWLSPAAARWSTSHNTFNVTYDEALARRFVRAP